MRPQQHDKKGYFAISRIPVNTNQIFSITASQHFLAKLQLNRHLRRGFTMWRKREK